MAIDFDGEYSPPRISSPPGNAASHDFSIADADVSSSDGALNDANSVLLLDPGQTTGAVTFVAEIGGPAAIPHQLNLRYDVVFESVPGGFTPPADLHALVTVGGGVSTARFPAVTINDLVAGNYEISFEVSLPSFTDGETIVVFDEGTSNKHISEFDVVDAGDVDTQSPELTVTIDDSEFVDPNPSLPVRVLKKDNPSDAGAQVVVDIALTDCQSPQPTCSSEFANSVTLQTTLTPAGSVVPSSQTFNVNAGDSVDETLQLTVTVPGPGTYSLEIEATDLAGLDDDETFQFAVAGQVGEPTANASGTPVFNEIYDLRRFLDDSPVPPPNPVATAQVWQMAFDKTTQTIWFNAEFGDLTGHFDPATGAIRVIDTSQVVSSGSNPHGVFFDFDSHLTPKVWIAHRNAEGELAGVGDEGKFGLLSFLEVRPNADGSQNLVTFSFENVTSHHLEDFHAAFVDALGDVWVVADHDNKIARFSLPSIIPTDPATITQTLKPTVTIYDVPRDIAAGGQFQPHGLEVVVDERTGEQYVWMIAEGGTGQVALLRPGAGSCPTEANCEKPNDLWLTWTGMPGDFVSKRGTFVKIDDNETPGIPDDDKVLCGLSG